MASIYRRKDTRSGRWVAVVRRRGHPTVTRTFETKARADDWALHEEKKLLDGDLDIPSAAERRRRRDLTLEQALQSYRSEVSAKRTNAKSRREETYLIDDLIREIGSERVWHFQSSSSGIRALVSRLTERGLSPDSIRLRLATISRVYTWLRTERDYPTLRSPLSLLPARLKPRPRRRQLEIKREDVPALLDACPTPALRDLVEFAIVTGMRRGQIQRLTNGDVTWHDDVGVARVTTKAGRYGVREEVIPLSPRACEILRRQRVGADGKFFHASKISHQFRAIADRAGFSKLTFHGLRHLASSSAIGLSLREKMTYLGHSTAAMAVRYDHAEALAVARRLAEIESR